MEKGLVSVVLPIYNVEKYLDRCVQSVVDQTYGKLEILLVDDGSPDRCPEMCDEWAKKDGRIRAIHKANEGLGLARNTGMENASGEYVCFIDGDDYVDPQTIQLALAQAEQTGADVTVYGLVNVDRFGKAKNAVVPSPSRLCYCGAETREEFLPKLLYDPASGLTASACCMLYAMKTIRESGWRFVSEREIVSEDTYSLLRLFASVQKVAVVPRALYYYCRNDDSLTHTYRRDRYEKIRTYYDECAKLCAEEDYGDRILSCVGLTYFSFTIAAMKQIVASGGSLRRRYAAIREIVRDEHMAKAIRNTDLADEKRTRRAFILAAKRRWSPVCFGLICAARVRNG